jgi:hypothetical protein
MKNQIEIWEDIPSYEGYYQVSSLGRVKSLSNNKSKKEKILKPKTNTNKYLSVILSKKNVKKHTSVHQLVAMAFLGHKPKGMELVVNHKNFIRHDNRLENLEIVTARENSNLKHIKSSSKYIGVGWNNRDKKWASYFTIKKKTINLGYFENELDASKMYQIALENIKNYNGDEKKFKELIKTKIICQKTNKLAHNKQG